MILQNFMKFQLSWIAVRKSLVIVDSEPRARPQDLIGWAAAAAAGAKSIAWRGLEAVWDAGNYLGTNYQQHIRKYQKFIFHDFAIFRGPKIARDRRFRGPYSDPAGGHQKNVQQARSATESEVRGFGRALRRLNLSNQPMGQLRGEWRRPEMLTTASSRPKRPWDFEIFVCPHFGDFQVILGDFGAISRRGHAKT